MIIAYTSDTSDDGSMMSDGGRGMLPKSIKKLSDMVWIHYIR